MRERLISFKTAKLAKEKGFNETCFYLYFPDKSLSIDDTGCDNETCDPDNKGYIAKPTQSLLQKWLREKYDIHIEINLFSLKDKTYFTSIYEHQKSINNLSITCDTKECPTYEEALEDGLFKALGLI